MGVAWFVRVILHRKRKHASVRFESFLRDIPRGTPLESLGNRDAACKATRYIILHRPTIHVCNGEVWNKTHPVRCILPTVHHYRDPFISLPRANISHACVPRVLIITMSYIIFIFSVALVNTL